jgi:hypothetical protein
MVVIALFEQVDSRFERDLTDYGSFVSDRFGYRKAAVVHRVFELGKRIPHYEQDRNENRRNSAEFDKRLIDGYDRGYEKQRERNERADEQKHSCLNDASFGLADIQIKLLLFAF